MSKVMNFLQMIAPSESYARLRAIESENAPIEPYQNLANAIVCMGVDDYRTALQENNTELIAELDEFFASDWYKTLCKIEPSALLRPLIKEFLPA